MNYASTYFISFHLLTRIKLSEAYKAGYIIHEVKMLRHKVVSVQ